jgi:Family of unknown function (DUF5689)
MKNPIKTIFIVLFTLSLFSSCVNDVYDIPKDCTNDAVGLAKTKEVADIWAVAINPIVTPPSVVPQTPIYTADDIIEGYVISSDEGGNFYKSMYVQPLDGSKGFNFSINEGNVYTQKFQPGKKVFLKLKGLAYANPSSFARGLTFGAPPTDKYVVDRLSTVEFKKHLIPSCDIISEDLIVHPVTLSQAMSDTYLNTLVEISDVQFKTDCATYSKPDFDTSLKITNGTATLDLRTSRYANFAGYLVPSGRGKIRGVLSKYNNGYQLVIRTQRDVKMTGPRVQAATPAKGGTGIVYSGNFTENLESYSNSTGGATLPKYVNEPVVGATYWDVATFSNNKYLKISAFNNGCTKSYFVVPVDMTTANNFSFKTLDGYNDGQPLKVYYSMNYTPGQSVTQATLIDITNSFTFSTGHTTGYGSSFVNSGDFRIPVELIGNGYFIFEYDGTNGITTTMEVDDITIN